MTSFHRITEGLDLPIQGEPEQAISESPQVRRVALVGDDYVGMKPTMVVAVGDQVRLGQVVFTDKKTPGVQFTAPASGTVSAINRGAKRKFESLVIEIEGEDSETGQETFNAHPDDNLTQLDRRAVCEQLVASGLWTALRTRPYSQVPTLESVPDAIFVTAIDTNPLAADPATVLADRPADFVAGLDVMRTLTEGDVHVCRKAGSEIPGEDKTTVKFQVFDGPHPAGLVGTHIHLLEPVSSAKTVWTVGYQDVVAIGHLFLTGRLLVDRIVSLAGPLVSRPRLIRTRLGASLAEMTEGQFSAGPDRTARVISGSVLSGRHSAEPVDYLGRFHDQISVIAEGGDRELLGWMTAGQEKFSIRRIFASAWQGEAGARKRFAFNTSTEGSRRAMIPIGMYEQVMPLDLVATPLLKSLITEDTEYAQQLGVLELDEEDLALCTFVCPGKYEYGPMLRKSLTTIEREG
ncbi:MAG: Na(+)-translocating NADH-quinone reductase subunit A [Planctomycetes bacterium]|nr:Na(+)-translocating NADH-quinone reductase subunit A [Planctomycetota bacterium]